jgi:hypothetical protein
MKTTIRETNSLGIFLEFMWAIFIVGGTAYQVFEKGHSGWWFLLALAVASTSISTKKTVVEQGA